MREVTYRLMRGGWMRKAALAGVMVVAVAAAAAGAGGCGKNEGADSTATASDSGQAAMHLSKEVAEQKIQQIESNSQMPEFAKKMAVNGIRKEAGMPTDPSVPTDSRPPGWGK